MGTRPPRAPFLVSDFVDLMRLMDPRMAHQPLLLNDLLRPQAPVVNVLRLPIIRPVPVPPQPRVIRPAIVADQVVPGPLVPLPNVPVNNSGAHTSHSVVPAVPENGPPVRPRRPASTSSGASPAKIRRTSGISGKSVEEGPNQAEQTDEGPSTSYQPNSTHSVPNEPEPITSQSNRTGSDENSGPSDQPHNPM